MRRATLFLCLLAAVLTATAGDYDLPELKLSSDVMPELRLNSGHKQRPSLSQLTLPAVNPLGTTAIGTTPTSAPAQWTWMHTNEGVQPYKVMDDLSFAGVPVFLAGVFIKSEKKGFRQDYEGSPANTRLLTHFKTHVDDYTQYFGPAMTLGLKVGGVEGRSDWGRMLASAAMSYGLMAGLVNGIKYTASELRPDGTTRNSWPSGHTATSFVGATILHKEYGLTRSPWYSLAGYGVATATGVMRVLNNRHWVSDVLSGAGIGIMSGELAYALSDVIFKDRGLLRNDLADRPNLKREHPSFFDISMGVGFGSKDITFEGTDFQTDDDDFKLEFGTSTAVQAEGAYFINNFIGVGGRMRVRTSPINGWGKFRTLATGDITETLEEMKSLDADLREIGYDATAMQDIIQDYNITIESDHLTEFALDAGLYFNIPLSNRFSIGTKALIGRSLMQALDINANIKGQVKGVSYDADIRNGQLDEESLDITDFYDTGESYESEWDYLTVEGNSSTKYGTGISLTYAYKGNFCWKLFFDYDYTQKTYTMTYDPNYYISQAMPSMLGLASLLGEDISPQVYKRKKDMHQFVIGASFSISF